VNRIVRTHYPVEKLPDDLREELASSVGHVTVVVEAEEVSPRKQALLDLVRAVQGQTSTFKSNEEIVEYVRAVRDGGDLSPWLAETSTATRTR
jgi:hypothetical protein